MPVLDMLCRDPRITRVTLIEPDVYKPHNVERHLFPLSAVGEFKADLAERWLKERRPDLEVRTLVCDLLDPAAQAGDRSRRPSRRHRRLRGRQRAGQVSLGRPDAPPRQALDAGRSAQRRHRRLRPLVRAGRALLWLRGQPFAARGGGGQAAGARLLAARRPGGRDDHPGQQGVHPRPSPLCTPWSRSACWTDPAALRPRLHQPAADAAAGARCVRRGVSSLPVSDAALGRLLDLPARVRHRASSEELDVALDQALARLGDE